MNKKAEFPVPEVVVSGDVCGVNLGVERGIVDGVDGVDGVSVLLFCKPSCANLTSSGCLKYTNANPNKNTKNAFFACF